jgi:hypothetical protein
MQLTGRRVVIMSNNSIRRNVATLAPLHFGHLDETYIFSTTGDSSGAHCFFVLHPVDTTALQENGVSIGMILASVQHKQSFRWTSMSASVLGTRRPVWRSEQRTLAIDLIVLQTIAALFDLNQAIAAFCRPELDAP